MLILIAVTAPALTSAQSVTITQIDSSALLTRQRVDLYLSLTDAAGEPVDGAGAESFRVFESPDGRDFSEVPVLDFEADATASEGVSFFLLVDNSGSMYDSLEGRATENPAEQRISHARNAIRSFLSDIDNPRDQVGLASFNTFYRLQAEPSRNTGRIDALLDEISRPDREESYTELYAGIREAVDDLAVAPGRKVLIVLSDGENYPYFEHSGEAHPEYGERLFRYEEAVERAQREGVSVFAVNFGPNRDSNLDEIAVESGGRVYDASDQSELAEVYGDIRRRVLQEYRLSYRATAAPAERKYVRVEYEDAPETTRFYFASTIFGTPAESFSFLILIPLLVAVVGWLLIHRLRFTNRRQDANLEVIGGRTEIFPLKQQQTVVGTSEKADVTVAGGAGKSGGGRAAGSGAGGSNATVAYDPQSDTFTVESDEEIRVNNQPVKRKRLEPGDVLSIGDSTIVFDDTRQEE